MVLQVLFHPKQLTLVTAGDDADVRVWDLVSKSCTAVLKVGPQRCPACPPPSSPPPSHVMPPLPPCVNRSCAEFTFNVLPCLSKEGQYLCPAESCLTAVLSDVDKMVEQDGAW